MSTPPLGDHRKKAAAEESVAAFFWLFSQCAEAIPTACIGYFLEVS